MPIDLVTGGSGFIGRHVVSALRAGGARVRVLDPAPYDGGDGAAVDVVSGSILDVDRVDAAMADVRRVYHLAGIAKLWSRDRRDFDRINAVGTATVMRAAAAHGVARVVHCSTEAILLPKHGDAGAPIDETAQPDLSDMAGPYTRSKLAAEQTVRAAVRSGLDALIVNPTVPIGPGDRNLTPPAAMLAMFLSGRSPAYLDCMLNLVDVRDVAAGIVLAGERGRTGERYILGGQNIALRDLLSLLEQMTSRSMPKRVSARVVGAGGGCGRRMVRRSCDGTDARRHGRGRQACPALRSFRQRQSATGAGLYDASACGHVGRRGGLVEGRRGGCVNQARALISLGSSCIPKP